MKSVMKTIVHGIVLVLGIAIVFGPVKKVGAQNLIMNPGCDDPLVDGKIPYWNDVAGGNWTQRYASPPPHSDTAYFFPGVADVAELQQDVDVSAFSSYIDNGSQTFAFTGYVRSYLQSPSDQTQIILECFDDMMQNKLDSFDLGENNNTDDWLELSDTLIPPASTRHIRIRLISTRFNGSNNDGYYDDLSLMSTENSGIDDDNMLSQTFIKVRTYPNPCKENITFEIDNPVHQHLEIIIYDVHGIEVATIHNSSYQTGVCHLSLNTTAFPCGIYLYQISSNDKSGSIRGKFAVIR